MMKRLSFEVGGDQVRARLYTPDGPPGPRLPLVLFSHGLASSQVEFYDFPQAIADKGYACLTLDYRGHGESEGQRGIIGRQRALEDLHAAIDAARKEYGVDGERIAIVGHSLGAAWAICNAAFLPEVRCVVALAPPARLQDEMNLFEFLGYNVARVVNLPFRLFSKGGLKVPYKVDYGRLYTSKEAIQRARKDDFLQGWLPVRNYETIVRGLDISRCATQLHIPTLVCYAQYDQVIQRKSSRRVYEAIPAPKRLVDVPQSGHSMCGDERSAFVAAHVVEWLDEHVKGVKPA